MNWMDFNKTGDFWKAWQDTVNGSSSQNQASTDPMKAWWNQQERFWKDAMEKTTGMLGNQPDLARQWQDMQGNFMKQWMEMAQQATTKTPNMGAGPSDMWKQFAQQTETWYADAFKNKLPEQLRPHFQTYMDMYNMFTTQWENIQGMVKNGLVEPKMIWQMINPSQYADAVGKVMGFKPMKDLDEVTRQANQFFEQMREAAMKLFPAAEEQALEMNEAFTNWSNQQSDQFFPFMKSIKEMMNHNLEPYLQVAGDDTQTEVLRSLKEMQFSYLAYIHHSSTMQKMVLDAGAQVLPTMMQEARESFNKEHEMPSFDTFFTDYMNRLEDAIVETMHTEKYTATQNEVLASGAKSKMIYDEMLENIFKDLPFMTKREADDLAKETTQLRRRVRDLEARMENATAPMNGSSAKATPKEAPKAAPKVTAKAAPKVEPVVSSSEEMISRIGKAEKGAADDLKEIKGIGEKLESMLHEIGVTTYKQVAKMDDAVYVMIDDLIPAFKGRAKRDAWAVQAKKLLKTKSPV